MNSPHAQTTDERTHVVNRSPKGGGKSSVLVAPAALGDTDEVPPSSVVGDGGDSSATNAVGGFVIHRMGAYPQAGEKFCGFEILSELGRGGMGMVYLARQPDMASRQVVLKVGGHLSSECEKLAKLQHPNIVPVYSFHQHEKLQAVCMPYRGPLTLNDILTRLGAEQIPTLNGHALTTVLDDCRRLREQTIAEEHRPTTVEAALPEPAQKSLFDQLRGLSYVDAVLTIVRQVAEGLRFAHGERIIHSDLKPANILIAENGSPQLIDFGIAYDRTSRKDDAIIGGTRPYSSPEQLLSLLNTELEHDERADLYSLGVILYQITTGKMPFETSDSNSRAELERDRQRRFQPYPSPRRTNPAIPPAVESIIAKCLVPHEQERYQSASELIEDLDRQLARQPLKYASNTSASELVTKWFTRNRWVVAAGVTLAIGGTAIASLSLNSSRQQEELRSVQAFTQADRYELDSRRAQAALATATTDRVALETGIRAVEQALAPYRVLDVERWWEQGDVAKLPPQRVTQLRERTAEVLLDLSRTAALRAMLGERETWLARAKTWNQKSEQTFPTTPAAVWTQRAWIARLGDEPQAAETAATHAKQIPLLTAFDHRFQGRELMEQGQWRAALPLLQKAVELDPTDFWASFSLGLTRYRVEDYRQAVAAFDVCVSLDPTVPGAFFNRGLSYLKLRQFAKAEEDFTKVIEAKRDWADPYLNRATARENQKKHQEAIADLTQALDLGYSPTAVLLARSRLYTQLEQPELARKDFEAGMQQEPTDDRGWITRGLARMPRNADAKLADYAASLRDFDRALELNPRSATALQYKARIYSMTRENESAIAALTEILRHYPETLDALSGRAMLYSRLGERAKAHADADAALKIGEQHPRTIYQLAGVYAMTSRQHSEDKLEAFRLLASALRRGYGYEHLATDRELEPLRSDPEFSRVVEDAKRVFEGRAK